MNEKIKELKQAAGIDYNPDQEGLDLFAELIVSECIDIADDLVNRNADGTWTSNELYTDYNGALFEVKRRIQESFGVEDYITIED